ncbi:hypothetical protein LMG19087_02964 [Ralstonia wenshanensis]|nr:hypothetical protein LMG19087_02964 [Ralstonia wenshanensis]
MVNNQINLTIYSGEAPPSDGCADHERLIVGGRLYPLEQLLPVFEKGSARPVTRKARRDAANRNLDDADLLELARQAAYYGRYKNSLWCRTGAPNTWAACDAYVLERTEYIPAVHKDMCIEYYVKLGIARTGALLLIVSIH